MRTLMTLFLLAGTAAPAFSQARIAVAYDTVSTAKHKSPGIVVAKDTIRKNKYDHSRIVVVSDTIQKGKYDRSRTVVVSDTVPSAKYKPFNKMPADTSRKKKPAGPMRSFTYPPVHPNAKKRDSIMGFLNSLPKKQSPGNSMPNAMAVQPFPSANTVYKGNNGEGFDIYESKIDRMPVLVPDSSNTATLKLPGIFRKPK